MGRSQDHTVVCDIYSHLNIAQGKLNGYSNIYTTLDYHSIETIYPAYPRQLVTKTVILLDGGGLYVQDGELSLNAQFPNDVLSEFVINSVVHPGDSLSLVSGGQSKAILTTDGVDKWNYNGKLYDWWDVEIYYVAYGIPDTQIDGHDYEG